jgi:hypothetical protein
MSSPLSRACKGLRDRRGSASCSLALRINSRGFCREKQSQFSSSVSLYSPFSLCLLDACFVLGFIITIHWWSRICTTTDFNHDLNHHSDFDFDFIHFKILPFWFDFFENKSFLKSKSFFSEYLKNLDKIRTLQTAISQEILEYFWFKLLIDRKINWFWCCLNLTPCVLHLTNGVMNNDLIVNDLIWFLKWFNF